MGVQGLWDLLAPVGRRVSVETLAGKRLAIDASIWMIQFMKAMRDEKGEMVRNAHLLGFFRRICKLLFLRTKPVFVFDGATPALKRRTVIARRRQRENAQAKIRKTAEKLLLNHVRRMRVQKLAEELKDQKMENNNKGKGVMLDQSGTLGKNDMALEDHNQEAIDEMLAASILAEECGGLDGNASTSAAAVGGCSAKEPTSVVACLTEDEDDEDDEEMILPMANGNVDPAVLAALPPSMQLDLLVQMRERLMAENRQKYQKVKKAPQRFSELQIEAYLKTVAFRREIDEVQRAAAGRGVGGVQTSRIASEANREFIFSSSFSGDKQLLAPGGAEKNPEIQKQAEKPDSSLDILNVIASASRSNPEAGPATEEPVGEFGADVQTFLDERGRMRVSTRRAMGIRMTRDLQRNIDLMKELEQERTTLDNTANSQIEIDNERGTSGKSPCESQLFEAIDEFNGDSLQINTETSLLEVETQNSRLALKNETCIEISFDDDGQKSSLDGDDEFFTSLAAGNAVKTCSARNSVSHCEWDEGLIGKGCGSLTNGNKLGKNSSHAEDGNDSESDVEWEDGISLVNDNKLEVELVHEVDSKYNEIGVEWQEGTMDTHEDTPEFCADIQKAVSKGVAEEEAALQEAIRRSLEDSTDRRTSDTLGRLEKSNYTCKKVLQPESGSPESSLQLGNVSHDIELSQSFLSETNGSNTVAAKGAYAPGSPGMHLRSAAPVTSVAITEPGAPIGTKKGLHQQQQSTLNEHALTGNLAGTGSEELTQVANDALSNSLHLIPEDMAKDTESAPACNSSKASDVSVGLASSFVESQISDIQRSMTEDICRTGVERRGHDVKACASKDEDNSIELVGASLEEELFVLGEEYKNLGKEQRRLERNADSVNSEMFVECQELLQMFGLPYIIAPMEAEAQCAYMELANLVEGVVTDDSDVFLFGARSVYKNIFDDRKYVETYFMKDIESELGLNREKLIRMALLLGSDYTEGVSGIGIVNAIEVVNAFPEEDGLHKFREWIESPDPAILGKVGIKPGSSSKNRSKASKNGTHDAGSDVEGTSASGCKALQENEVNQAVDGIPNIKKVFMDKHRNVSKNWHIPVSFPSEAVISAYIVPQVDKSTEPFAWGKPDILSLRRLCWEKFGWASLKADELLLPVLKEYNKHETQLRLEAFYTFNERFAKIRSKRIKQAVKGITGKQSEVANNDDLQAEKMKKRKASSSNKNSKRDIKRTDPVVGETKNPTKKSQLQQVRDEKEGSASEEGKRGLLTEAEERRLKGDGSIRGRGRWKGKAVGRARRKADSELDDTSTDSDSNCDDHENEMRAEKVEVPEIIRRSKRARKATHYLEKDEESEESYRKSNDEAAEAKPAHYESPSEDDVANSSRGKEYTTEDPYPGGGSSIENNHTGPIQSDDAHVNIDSDYLQMGGGFCMDENEEHRDLQQSDGGSPTVVTVDDTSIASVEGLQADEETTNGNLSNLIAGKIEDDDASNSMSAFSAIPYLKRKKR